MMEQAACMGGIRAGSLPCLTTQIARDFCLSQADDTARLKVGLGP